MSDKTQAVAKFFVDEAKKWVARMSMLALASVLLFLFTPLFDRMQEIWRSPELLQRVIEKLDQLSTEVNRATGEDRVIFEVPGQTYVREPVHLGEQITLNIVVRRTKLGAACTLLHRTAIFTDESGIANAGPTLRPARQVGNADTQVRLMLDVPEQVQQGRVTVYLSLEFDCNGKTVFDQTRPVAFPAARSATSSTASTCCRSSITPGSPAGCGASSTGATCWPPWRRPMPTCSTSTKGSGMTDSTDPPSRAPITPEVLQALRLMPTEVDHHQLVTARPPQGRAAAQSRVGPRLNTTRRRLASRASSTRTGEPAATSAACSAGRSVGCRWVSAVPMSAAIRRRSALRRRRVGQKTSRRGPAAGR